MPTPCSAVVNLVHAHYLNWIVCFVPMCTASLSPGSELGCGTGRSRDSAQHSAAPLLRSPPLITPLLQQCSGCLGQISLQRALTAPVSTFSGKRPIYHFTFSALGVRHLGISEEKLYKCIQKRSPVLQRDTGSGRQKS